MTAIHYWHELSGPELAALGGCEPVVVLPVAAIEQHGPHLPLATDVIIAESLVAEACRGLSARGAPITVVVMPTLDVGASAEHESFAGTLSLGAEQTTSAIRARGAAAARAGFRRLVLVNSHGGNKASVDIAALQLRSEFDLLAVKAHYFRFAVPGGLLDADELAHGLHGGALETAMIMHLAPGAVRRAALTDFDSLGARRARAGRRLGPEGDAGFAWRAEDLNPAGVAGNAAAADAATGARLVVVFGDRLREIFVETAAFDLNDLGGRGAG